MKDFEFFRPYKNGEMVVFTSNSSRGGYLGKSAFHYIDKPRVINYHSVFRGICECHICKLQIDYFVKTYKPKLDSTKFIVDSKEN